MRIVVVYVLVGMQRSKRQDNLSSIQSITPANLEYAKEGICKAQLRKGTSCFYRCRRADTARNQHMRRTVRLGHFCLDLSGSLLV